VTAGIYDDRDPLVTYKGSWGNNLDPNRYNDTQSFSNNAGDSASFTFTGNQISYVFARQWNLGNLQISIDGAPQTPPANLYSATEVGEQVITYSNLSYATHTITVTVAGMPVSGSSNSYVVIDAFIVGPVGAFAGAYDDQDPAIVYSSSGWGMNSAAMRYDGTQHFSQQAGSTASFTFTGTQVNYVYELQNNAGQAQVSIDGTVVAAQLDEYAAAATGPTVASYSGLSNATHTITITALGTSNPRSSSAYVIVDAFFTGPVATISGNISAPVSGTTVTLSGGSSGGSSLTGNTLESVTVGSNGTYSLPVAAGPNYTVTPSLANATFSPISLSFSEVRTNLPGENFTATMNAPAPPTSYQISGQVVFGNGPSVNTGVPNVTLTLSNGQSATSLSDGSYSFTVNAAGAYTITASYPGSPGFYALSAPKAVTVASTSAAYPNNNFTVTFVSGGSLSPSSPSKEYIFLNGSIIAVEHPH
jgi:hypothetical protein